MFGHIHLIGKWLFLSNSVNSIEYSKFYQDTNWETLSDAGGLS
jgi:hypothetical protein